MLLATDAFRAAQKVNEVHDILCILEEGISNATKEGKFKCTVKLDSSFRNSIDSAIEIVSDAGYEVNQNLFIESHGEDIEDTFYRVDISWENAEL